MAYDSNNALYLRGTPISETPPSNDEVLKYNSTSGEWELSPGGAGYPLTTKGDLYTFSTSADRLAVGSNGSVLVADSGETTGLKYASSVALNRKIGTPITGTSYTLALTDANKFFLVYNAANQTITIPPHSSVPLPDEVEFDFFRTGAGIVNFVAGSGVTINGGLILDQPNSPATFKQAGIDNWVSAGALV